MTRRTASQRAKDATTARVAAGGRVLRVILSPEARRALDRLTAAGGTMTEEVEAALLARSPPPLDSDPAGWITAAVKAGGRHRPAQGG